MAISYLIRETNFDILVAMLVFIRGTDLGTLVAISDCADLDMCVAISYCIRGTNLGMFVAISYFIRGTNVGVVVVISYFIRGSIWVLLWPSLIL